MADAEGCVPVVPVARQPGFVQFGDIDARSAPLVYGMADGEHRAGWVDVALDARRAVELGGYLGLDAGGLSLEFFDWVQVEDSLFDFVVEAWEGRGKGGDDLLFGADRRAGGERAIVGHPRHYQRYV